VTSQTTPTGMRVYIAGPMTGVDGFNFPAFDKAAAKYRALGNEVISPAEHERANGLDTAGLTGDPAELEGKFDLAAALLWDLAQVAAVDAVVLLDGWERSSGVRAELALAEALGKGVILDGSDHTTTEVPLSWAGPVSALPPVLDPASAARMMWFDNTNPLNPTPSRKEHPHDKTIRRLAARAVQRPHP